ncbi:MAG: ATP-binding protein [Microthrixaceae bacterium]
MFDARVSPRIDDQSRGLLIAVVALRFALLVWAAIVVGIDIRGVTEIRGGSAAGLLCLLGIWTAIYGWLLLRRPQALTRALTSGVDVTLAAVVAASDMWIYSGRHPQSFASAWPLCAAIVAGIIHGKRIGAAAGVFIGTAGALGISLFADGGLQHRWLGAVGTIVLMTVSGALSGLVTGLLREAELATARADAREEVARQLHDGVMQTLAAVQRRSDDEDLVALAREQELDLRRFIGSEPQGAWSPGSGLQGSSLQGSSLQGSGLRAAAVTQNGDLVASLRDVLSAAERRHDLRCELVVIDVPTTASFDLVDKLSGVVTEAITNAAKHGSAGRVIVCVDSVDGWLTCTVNDDGSGFDPTTTAEGTGLARSMRGRVRELSGTLDLRSSPGEGCEISIVLPL